MTNAAQPAAAEPEPDLELEAALQRYAETQRDFASAILLPKNAPDRARRIKAASEIQAAARLELWQARQRSNPAREANR